jgi:hypothetical protein
MSREAQQAAHEAISGLLDEGEIAVGWTLTIDVAGQDNVRYLAHRAGGGVDGSQRPMVWTAMGMLQASLDAARDQLRDSTTDA